MLNQDNLNKALNESVGDLLDFLIGETDRNSVKWITQMETYQGRTVYKYYIDSVIQVENKFIIEEEQNLSTSYPQSEYIMYICWKQKPTFWMKMSDYNLLNKVISLKDSIIMHVFDCNETKYKESLHGIACGLKTIINYRDFINEYYKDEKKVLHMRKCMRDAHEWIKKLDGITYKDWCNVKFAMERAFELKMKQADEGIELSSDDKDLLDVLSDHLA